MELINLSYLLNLILDDGKELNGKVFDAKPFLSSAVAKLNLGELNDVKAALLINFNMMPADLQYFLRMVEREEPRKNAKNIKRLRSYFSFA